MDLFRSAKDLLKEQLKTSCRLSSSCQDIDHLLGGGCFDTSSLTQISGANGTGKTQLCFQLCVNVQLPAELGGLDGEALFIDTNKTFSSNRICEIAHHTLLNYSPGRIPHKSCEKDFLSGVHVYECIHGVELYGMSQRILPILERFCKVRLIIIDNLASALRSEEDISHRTKLLTAIGTTLHKIAFTRNILIVVTNQVTTKFRTNDNRGVIFPALGELWSYFPDTKLSVYRMNQKRSIILEKSPTMPLAVADFCINAAGVRSVVTSSISSSENVVKSETISKTVQEKEETEKSVKPYNDNEETVTDEVLLENLCSPWILTQAEEVVSSLPCNQSQVKEDTFESPENFLSPVLDADETELFLDSGCQSFTSAQSNLLKRQRKPNNNVVPCSNETSDLSLTSDDIRPLSPVLAHHSNNTVLQEPSSPVLHSSKPSRSLSPVFPSPQHKKRKLVA